VKVGDCGEDAIGVTLAGALVELGRAGCDSRKSGELGALVVGELGRDCGDDVRVLSELSLRELDGRFEPSKAQSAIAVVTRSISVTRIS
jgi:hypothetical protein